MTNVVGAILTQAESKNPEISVNNGVWFENYSEFEDKKNRTNNLVSNFVYSSSQGALKGKVFLRKPVLVPSIRIWWKDEEKLDKAIEDLQKIKPHASAIKAYIPYYSGKREELESLGADIEIWNHPFCVFNLEIEKDKNILDKLPKSRWELGEYDKTSRIDGNYPERKVTLDSRLERAFELAGSGIEENRDGINHLLRKLDKKNQLLYNEESKNFEIHLNSENGITHTNEFLTQQEFERLVWWYVDIEKPLWKRKDEKAWLDRREKWVKRKQVTERGFAGLKAERYSWWFNRRTEEKDEERTQRISRIIKKLEDRLTLEHPIVGKVELYKEDYEAKVSHVASIFKLSDGSKVKEIDTLRESSLQQLNGFNIITHETEKDLVMKLTERAQNRLASVWVGYVTPYDSIQLRDAAIKTKAGKFDVTIENITPSRDYVRLNQQRMHQSTIFIDLFTLVSNTFLPFLRSKMPKGSHRLEDVMIYLKSDFRKILTHKQLRDVELRIIKHRDEQAVRTMHTYVGSDIPPLEEMISELLPVIPFLMKAKKAIPSATYTEIAFSPRSMLKNVEERHWRTWHNKRFHGYEEKIRMDRTAIFRKRHPAMKREWIEDAGINTMQVNGHYKEVMQMYFPLEKFLLPHITRQFPEDIKSRLEDFYTCTKDNNLEHFGALRYFKAVLEDMLVDFYFCLRERRQKERLEDYSLLDSFERFEREAERENLDAYAGAFKSLKNSYRSIYASLKGKTKESREAMSLIRERKKVKINPEQLTLEFLDRFEEENEDIVLLRENADKVLPFLTDAKKKELERFLKTFSKLEEISSDLQGISEPLIKASELRISPRDFVYLYNQSGRADSEERKFLNEYGITPLEMEYGIKQAYSKLAQELREKSMQVLRARGDYLFVKKIGDERLDASFEQSRVLLPLRRIENFILSDSYKETQGEYASDLFQEMKDSAA